MGVLPVTLASVKLLLGISDTSQDAGITALIALEQPALEYALDPAILAYTASDSGLLATLTLGATECLAGAFLATAGRNPESLPQQTVFKISVVEIATKPLALPTALGLALVTTGLARLKPFSRSERSLARSASGGDALMDDQAPVPLMLGSGMGTAGAQPTVGGALGPPPDPVFDGVLGVDGVTEPPSGDILSPGVFFASFDGGPE
jgi:hypothetical protein